MLTIQSPLRIQDTKSDIDNADAEFTSHQDNIDLLKSKKRPRSEASGSTNTISSENNISVRSSRLQKEAKRTRVADDEVDAASGAADAKTDARTKVSMSSDSKQHSARSGKAVNEEQLHAFKQWHEEKKAKKSSSKNSLMQPSIVYVVEGEKMERIGKDDKTLEGMKGTFVDTKHRLVTWERVYVSPARSTADDTPEPSPQTHAQVARATESAMAQPREFPFYLHCF